jgi:pimeloyl-ACP methyl ester carboxylesterase
MTPDSPFAARLHRISAQERELSVLGSSTRFWVYGDEDAATTVVVVHGYRGEHHGLEPIIAELPSVRFISPDLPGFGKSTPLTATDHSIDGYAKWLTAFVSALELPEPPVVLGHSFGSIISSAAIVAGLALKSLILINPIAISGLRGPRPLATWLTVAYYRLAGRLPERVGFALLHNWLIVQAMSSSLAKTQDPVRRAWIHAEHHRFFNNFASRDVVVEGFFASISADVSEFAAAITVPTLLIAADLDDITPVAAQYDLQKLFPHATLRILTGVGHLIHYEVPELAAAAITDFLAEAGA